MSVFCPLPCACLLAICWPFSEIRHSRSGKPQLRRYAAGIAHHTPLSFTDTFRRLLCPVPAPLFLAPLFLAGSSACAGNSAAWCSAQMALVHSASSHWQLCRGAGRRTSLPKSISIRTRVARPGTAAVPADKGAVVVQPGSNGQPKGNEYIAGPFGSGRLSQDGECGHAAACSAGESPSRCKQHSHACCAAPCTIPLQRATRTSWKFPASGTCWSPGRE